MIIEGECTMELQLDRDIFEEIEDVLGPMGWTAEEYLEAIVLFLANPANEEIIAAHVAQWRRDGLIP